MKKILGIFAASAAALGSAMISATPVRAQSATLPVEVTVTRAIFLRTYQDLKFVVSQQDLQQGASVEQTGTYDESASITALSTDLPTGGEKNDVEKTIPQLYQIWGANDSTTVQVEASKPTLTASTAGGVGTSTETVTMSILDGGNGTFTDAQNSAGNPYKEGSVKLNFNFSNPSAASGTTYTGGELTIRITNP
ncbi:MAG: hypothetical protein AAFS12_13780 [Cyanobacteria bacterium J06632_19]